MTVRPSSPALRYRVDPMSTLTNWPGRIGIVSSSTTAQPAPAGAHTVPHDHLDDRNEDVYAIIAGSSTW